MSRRLSRPLGLTLASLLFVLPGCQVDPFCLDCVDDGLDAGRPDGGDSGRRDGGDTGIVVDASTDDADLDAAPPPDGCTPLTRDICNMHDDDCDLAVDEDVDTTTDVDNCGSCGHRCTFAHAFAECVDSVCAMTTCDVNYYDRDGDPANGCESRCVTTAPDDSVCDNRDNDCDGLVDEDFDLMTDPDNCGICGRGCRFAHAMSSCSAGTCVVSGCEPGFVDVDGIPITGCEYACTATGAETCNLRDDDCDGTVDDGDPGSGATCGVSVGACMPGVEHCVGGSLVCTGGVSPGVESCNGVDDDCDGTIDDGNPEGGRSCGSSTGACIPGRETCTSGALVCTGAIGPRPETCNGVDDNCDGTADDGDPGSGATCGTDTGACVAGTVHCSGGGLACVGAVGPALDLCNGVDDDCDGTADQAYNLMTDPRNCGMCGRVCSFPNAIAGCTASACTLVACQTNFFNNDGMMANGCEYACTRVSSSESCNGSDDDCDGRVDELLTPPSSFCNPNGVCSTTSATCAIPTGSPPGTRPTWTCNYPAATFQATETRCDSLDNDCDGLVDEPFPGVGTSCSNGELGACLRTGTRMCNAAGTALVCSAPAVGTGTAEVCNGINDDCDGATDESSAARGAWTRVTGGSLPDFWIQSYEASRPDSRGLPGATTPLSCVYDADCRTFSANGGTCVSGSCVARPTTQGISSAMVCSEPNRLPWTNVLPADAAAACTLVGGTLCSEAQWQRACVTAAGTACTWSYSSTCNTYSSMRCNGNDYDSSAMAGDQDALTTTGVLPMCSVSWTVSGTTSSIYDLSGNAQEWTQPRAAGVNPIRGGSYNDAAGGLQCNFAFEVAADTIQLPNVGFRCCRSSAP